MLDKYFEYNDLIITESEDELELDNRFPSFYFTGKWNFSDELYVNETNTIFYVYKDRVKILLDNTIINLEMTLELFLDEFYRSVKKYDIYAPILFFYETGKYFFEIDDFSGLCIVAVIPGSFYYKRGNKYIKKEYKRENAYISKRQIKVKNNISSLSFPFKKDFIKNINKIKRAIIDGYTYQLNYTERVFIKNNIHPMNLFLLIKDDTSNFNSYFTINPNRVVISNSPERLFSIQGKKIKAEPIKGTISKKEENYLEKLKKSSKDNRELAMIVDLIRNDISAIVEDGTLSWDCPVIMELLDICHLYGIIQGDLKNEISLSNIIRSVFPGGSITGVPKKMTMKIIDDLERFPREVYTGSLGLIGKENTDLNILIRSFYYKKDQYIYGSGGGITYWSDPEKEWDELVLKTNKIKHFI